MKQDSICALKGFRSLLMELVFVSLLLEFLDPNYFSNSF